MRHLIAALVVGVLLAGTSDIRAQEFTSSQTDCSDLKIFAVAGVPDGATHDYQFRGICRQYQVGDGGKVKGLDWEGWVEVESRYYVKTAEFAEAVKVTMSAGSDGPPSGGIQIKLKCAQDPMITSSSCSVLMHAQKIPWPDFVQAWLKGAPYTKGKVTYAQAVSLSQLAASNTAPPPPPPPPAGEPKQGAGKAVPAVQSPISAVPPSEPKQGAGRAVPAVQSPTRSLPSQPPKPELAQLAVEIRPLPKGATEIKLAPQTRIELQSGRVLAVEPVDGSLSWTILDAGVAIRTFPTGARAYRNTNGEIFVESGEEPFNAGAAKPVRLKRP